MEEASTSFLMVFLLPFHIGGGAALGIALRKIFGGGFKLSNLPGTGFLLLWGSMFGGIPLIFGWAIGPGWFLPLQIGVFVGTIVLVAWQFEWLRDLYSLPEMWLASIGFVFFAIGAAVAVLPTSEGDPGGLLFGLIFGGIGGLLALSGVVSMLRR